MGAVTDCVFCDIVAGRAPASIVHEDEIALAIMTIGPVNPGHVLILPKQHAALLADLDAATAAHLFALATRVAAAIRRSGVRCEGINLFLADGEAAGQEIPHLHLHVFPRFRGDPFVLDADWTAKPARAELDAVAERIRAAYDTGPTARDARHS